MRSRSGADEYHWPRQGGIQALEDAAIALGVVAVEGTAIKTNKDRAKTTPTNRRGNSPMLTE